MLHREMIWLDLWNYKRMWHNTKKSNATIVIVTIWVQIFYQVLNLLRSFFLSICKDIVCNLVVFVGFEHNYLVINVAGNSTQLGQWIPLGGISVLPHTKLFIAAAEFVWDVYWWDAEWINTIKLGRQCQPNSIIELHTALEHQ